MEKIINKIGALLLAVCIFYFVGIVGGCIAIKCIGYEPTGTSIWSEAGFIFAFINAMVGIISWKLYKKLAKD